MQPQQDSTTSRPNLVLAAIVEQGIALQQTHGTHHAANFLHERKVALRVIERVLMRPHERRRSAAQAAPADWSGQAA
ncbi:MAG: hypothetical protein ACO1N5_15120 [Noviherbaspirillum sp.]